MKAAIISVGTELLFGDTLNTNATFLAKMLAQLEIHTMRIEVVGDNEERIAETLQRNAKTHDLIIFTGGLGPTVDDITKETVCKTMGLPLVPHHDSMMSMYERIGPNMTANNYKQALFPEGAEILKNERGTAPGMFYRAEDYSVVLLPGPPSEMIPMCENILMPLLKRLVHSTLLSKYLNVYGIGESKLEDMLKDLFARQKKVKIGTYFDGEKVTLRLTSSDVNRRRLQIEEVEAVIRRSLSDCLITEEKETIEEFFVKTMQSANLKVTVAESCTGGLLAEKIVRSPGASEIFEYGFVTYSDSAKEKVLKVDPHMIQMHGAVSRQTAHRMAKGALLISGADISCSITGLAGPEGDGSEAKPGDVVIAIMTRKDCEYHTLHLIGDRTRVRRQAAQRAMVLLAKKAVTMENEKLRGKRK